MIMNGDIIHDPTDKFADADYFPIYHRFAPHPTTEGVSKICVKAPSSLHLQKGYPVVLGDDDSYAARRLVAVDETVLKVNGQTCSRRN
jgi:hypothetical protein